MYYFAYGANINVQSFGLRCSDAILINSFILEDYEFFITSDGYASIRENKGSFVQGLVWEISELDEKLLDEYEGVDSNFYIKKYIFIKDFDNECLVYISTSVKDIKKLKDYSKYYLSTIIENAISLQFKYDYILQLNKFLK